MAFLKSSRVSFGVFAEKWREAIDGVQQRTASKFAPRAKPLNNESAPIAKVPRLKERGVL
jgi:hypothetical protein